MNWLHLRGMHCIYYIRFSLSINPVSISLLIQIVKLCTYSNIVIKIRITVRKYETESRNIKYFLKSRHIEIGHIKA